MLKNAVIQLLSEAGVEIERLSELVMKIKRNDTDLSLALIRQEVEEVLSDTETAEIILTIIILNIYANSNLLPEPLQTLIKGNKSHLNNVLPLFICNMYGSAGIIYYGHITKAYGSLLDEQFTSFNPGIKNMVAGIAAAACAKIDAV